MYTDVKIGLTEFKRLRPFNARAVKRSGCNCKVCEHYDGLRRGLHMKLMLCSYSKGDPAMAVGACVTGKCSKCGFSNRWKKLRAALLQNGPASFVPGENQAGIQLRPGAPSVFMKLVE